MKKFLCVMLSFLLLAALFGCAASEEETAAETPKTGVTINVYNWGEYISDGVDDAVDVLQEFTRATGINVNYTTFETNEAMYAKLAGGGANYDVIIPSDYMIAKMIKEDMLEPLDHNNIPNLKWVDEKFFESTYDVGCVYSVPYTWSIVGLFYNKDYVEEPDSFTALWDERYSGKILMFDNPRDAFAIAMGILGMDFNTENPDDWVAAAALLKEQKPLVQAYVMDQIFDKMENGEAWLAPYYAGDAAILVEENDNIGMVIPKESINYFVDAMCIPKGSQHKAEAEAFINFMCEPEISAANCEYIGYATPLSEARNYIDEEMVNNPNYYPDEETVARSQIFSNLSDETNALLDSLWAEVKMGGPGGTFTLILILALFILLYIGVVIYKRSKRKKNL